MKYFIITIILTFSLISCKEGQISNNYDEIIHYSILDEQIKTVEINEKFNSIFMNIYSHKISFKNFEKELVSFGYTKNSLDKEKIKKVDLFISNEIYYDDHLTACVPSYRDVLILKKNKKTIAVLKICFECDMVDKYGIINSTFKESNIDEDNYFVNFKKLYKILYNKEYKR